MADDAYRRSGVDIAAGNRTTDLMRDAVRSTYTDAVLTETGAFGGAISMVGLRHLDDPVLVASTDGVGTKTLVAAHMDRWNTIGQDLVNHCINDVLVQGARPLFFLDYVASAHLEPDRVAAVVGGMAAACREAGCALLGGETAEMPDVYHDDALDVVGTLIGAVDRVAMIDGERIQPGDVLLALPSSGLHTNGYSLARRVLFNEDWHAYRDDLGMTIGEALLAVHRSYLPEVSALQEAGIDVRGLAHITGGGVIDNLPRVLPSGCGAFIHAGSWPVPPIFRLIQAAGEVDTGEMFHTFNMGLGMLVIVPAADADRVQQDGLLPEVYHIGEVTDKRQGVTFVE